MADIEKTLKKILIIGDKVYSANQGKEMTIKDFDENGFFTEEDYFPFDEVRKTYFLTKAGYRLAKRGECQCTLK